MNLLTIADGYPNLTIIDPDKINLKDSTKIYYNVMLSSVQQILSQIPEINNLETTAFANDIVDLLLRDIKLFNQGIFQFRINPKVMSYNQPKLYNITKYGFGNYVVQPYGNDLLKISIQNTTGRLIPSDPVRRYLKKVLSITTFFNQYLILDPRFSNAYWNFELFKIYYRDRNKKLIIVFLDKLIIGLINNFNYNWDANDVHQIKWNLDITASPNEVFDMNKNNLTDVFSSLKGNKVYINVENSLQNNIFNGASIQTEDYPYQTGVT